MQTCKTCKHWKFDPAVDGWTAREYCAPLDQDTLKPMAMPFEVRQCKHPAKSFCERPIESNGFGTADGSNYVALLITGEDFGCMRHEAAPDLDAPLD